ncbi:MAG: potassium channel family protein [Microthrixaceae bacterium]
MSSRRSKEANTSERLEAYVARTQTGLDLFALFTLWIIAVPISSIGDGPDATWGGIGLRLSISAVFGIDMAIRAHLAPRSLAYLRTHPLGLLAVIFPPVRVVFSLRLITSLFRRGHIQRFLAAALILLLDGVLIVYFYEKGAAGANITTLGDAMWWAIVTVTTVGYGDTYPITFGGRTAATGIMALGVLTLAVITAEVSSSYMEQARRRRAAKAPADEPLQLHHLASLHERLDRIEAGLAREADSEQLGRGLVGDDGEPPQRT